MASLSCCFHQQNWAVFSRAKLSNLDLDKLLTNVTNSSRVKLLDHGMAQNVWLRYFFPWFSFHEKLIICAAVCPKKVKLGNVTIQKWIEQKNLVWKRHVTKALLELRRFRRRREYTLADSGPSTSLPVWSCGQVNAHRTWPWRWKDHFPSSNSSLPVAWITEPATDPSWGKWSYSRNINKMCLCSKKTRFHLSWSLWRAL